jgi:hypothetical protein
MPLGAVLQVGHPVQADAGRLGEVAWTCDSDVDEAFVAAVVARPLGSPERRDVTQGGGPGEEYAGPGALQPGRGAGVVDVDTRVDLRELASPQQAADVVGSEPGGGQLAPGDHAGLVGEEVVDVHLVMLGPRGRWRQWKFEPVENQRHAVRTPVLESFEHLI